jgi:Mg2+ and Co2+ transporter CorA
MVENPEESLWIHCDEPEDVFQLQGIFGLHPLSIDAVIHQNQPSKIEEYDEYLFAIIDGVRYEEEEEEEKRNKNDDEDEYTVKLIEDDLYIFLSGVGLLLLISIITNFKRIFERKLETYNNH